MFTHASRSAGRRRSRGSAVVLTLVVLATLTGCTTATDTPSDTGTSSSEASETSAEATTSDAGQTESTSAEASASETSAAPAATLPDGIELDAGWDVDDPGTTYDPPGRDVEGVNSELCGADAWPTEGIDRLATWMTGNESHAERELVLFESAERAADVVANIGEAVAACSSITANGIEYSIAQREAPLAPAGTVTYSELDASGTPGGDVHQFMVVGSAVFATVLGGEITESSVAENAEHLTTENVSLIQNQLCGLRPEGCSG